MRMLPICNCWQKEDGGAEAPLGKETACLLQKRMRAIGYDGAAVNTALGGRPFGCPRRARFFGAPPPLCRSAERLTTVAAVLYVAADAASRRPQKGSASRYVASHTAGSHVECPSDGWRVALSGRRVRARRRQSLCHCGVALRCCRWVSVPQCHS